ncbi:FAD dependent oxidoreductase superfamily [Aspergillus heteromorphus CBS 117.55]|uniref:FAD dependent oxidoreductase superfamily n=1 Tax=Aspergillus heteromorphus CBS 117.55 TaxID=1448321 RepID=A0A317W1S7_9EURO|nr:FAD dependent oxidoreductase superfamily [Aspergillus heteromorphus CBS 117.55]PWY79222.1 FAD dependent oxidoreductase superfamily [Aspergillus heteromorphus CBS 117.55]
MGELQQHPADTPSVGVPFAQRPIIILGAGIIGCATAKQLLLNGFPVILVAEFLPGDQDIRYASAWAGAAWHPAGGISPEWRYLQAITHRHLLRMAHEEPESGVCIVDALEYLEQPPSANSSVWGKAVASKWRDLLPSEYPPNFSCGWSYETLVTDPTHHMPYLGKKITALGGQFIQKRVDSLDQLYHLFPESSVFINASGHGSKTLIDVQDDQCFPERGQNVFYRTDNCRTMYFRNGREYTYVIPRPMSGGVVLGGVKQADDLSPDPDMAIAQDEIARAHRLAPEVVPESPADDALSYIVGIRPSRKGGFRLDAEKLGSRVVLSAYGFGGGGYAFSYGVADALVKMVEEAERENVIL